MSSAGFGDLRLRELFSMMDKAPQMIDDLHRMTNYIGDLRLITIVLAATSYAVGVVFLLFKLYMYKISRDRVERRYARDIVDVDGYGPQQVLVERSGEQQSTRSRRSPPVFPYSASGRAYLHSTETDPLEATLTRKEPDPLAMPNGGPPNRLPNHSQPASVNGDRR